MTVWTADEKQRMNGMLRVAVGREYTREEVVEYRDRAIALAGDPTREHLRDEFLRIADNMNALLAD